MQARALRPFLGGLIALLVGLSSAVAQVVPYDHQTRMKQEAMHLIYVRARYCMYTASKAMLYQGVRNRAAILAFSTGTCSSGLRSYLITEMSWSQADTSRLIEAIANLELDAASSSV